MSRTYKATGINLKAMPLGEADRLLTILTREYGLVRVVAPGARKTRSQLGGRTGLFVVNELLIAKGRSLDKLSQAETLASYPGLSKHLATLAASQYLAELVLYQALSDQPQDDLFCLLCERLASLETATPDQVLPLLTQSVFDLLDWGGVAPQVQACCLTQRSLRPDLKNPDWRIGFSLAAGGTVSLDAPELLERSPRAAEPSTQSRKPAPKPLALTAIELALLQQISNSGSDPNSQYPAAVWISVERLLRQYAQYYFDRPIRSAALMDSCFSPLPSVL
ncbi:MAG: DNA repair protein RecO [Aphanocapsa sp. GSE-SYN-MK-11-07L]|jgi:DNA repair protein RecO (recombination protein O)|nr:DNA repair protein RecO [Aphanocapsa sp. GSE-SYN-MK-11-07L]